MKLYQPQYANSNGVLIFVDGWFHSKNRAACAFPEAIENWDTAHLEEGRFRFSLQEKDVSVLGWLISLLNNLLTDLALVFANRLIRLGNQGTTA